MADPKPIRACKCVFCAWSVTPAGAPQRRIGSGSDFICVVQQRRSLDESRRVIGEALHRARPDQCCLSDGVSRVVAGKGEWRVVSPDAIVTSATVTESGPAIRLLRP